MLNDGDRRYLDLLKRCLTASVYDESAWRFLRTHVQVRSAPGNWAKAFWALVARALKLAADRSLLLLLKLPFDAEKRAEGKDWPLFAYTMVGHKRLDNVQDCVEDVVAKGVPGDLVETGVWRGGTVIFMRAVLKALCVTDRTVWACGYIIVDDYFSWPSCKRAVGDFLSKRKLAPELQTIDWTAVYWQVRR